MSIFRPENSPYWWIDLRTPNGKRIRRTTGTENRRQAQEYHDRVKAELWELDKLNKPPERTFADAAVKVLRMSEGQKDYGTKACHIEYWREVFSGRVLSSLTADEIIDDLPTHQLRREGDKRKTKKLAPATKNRYLATMSIILTVAEEAGWIVKKPKWDLFKESGIRIRWITKQQAQTLLEQIKTRGMNDVCSFALSTGARMSEILKLEWSQVDLGRSIAWVTADKAKSGRSQSIPLNGDAMVVLEKRKGCDKKWVFTRDTGVHPSDINRKCFKLALEKASIEDFHFHDLRHTWASWHVQAGTPLFVLKELGGWENLEMVKKYAHINAEHLARHADLVRFWPYQPETNAVETTKAACEAA